MHEVERARVCVHVGLNASLACCVRVKRAPTVKETGEKTKSVETESLHKREHHRKNHCANKCVSNNLEPTGIKIRFDTSRKSQRQWLLAEVCINKQKKESRIEELHNEGDLRRLHELLSLCRVADPGHKLDADSS